MKKSPRAKTLACLVRHEEAAPRERSTCGWRHRLISREDQDVAAWVHTVDIDGSRPHYHKVGTELYYVLEGEGQILLDGQAHPIRKGSLVHIPPGVVHGAVGRMRVLVVGIPDICDADLFFPEPAQANRCKTNNTSKGYLHANHH
jgi:quercetin dioxygenase-like cupin family protein